MGVLINAVGTLDRSNIAPRSPFGPETRTGPIKPTAIENCNFGSKFCLINSENRNPIDGIMMGDSKQTLLNTGMIAMYTSFTAGISIKGTLKTSFSSSMVSAAVGTGVLNYQYSNNSG